MISVDDRTGSAELFGYFTPGRAALMRLDSADFTFVGVEVNNSIPTVGIERKTVSEVLNDYERFVANQLEALQNSFTHPYLVVEGVVGVDAAGMLKYQQGHTWRPSGQKAASFYGRLQTLSELYGIHVFRTSCEAETVLYIQSQEDWFRKVEHKSTQCFYRPAPPLSPIRPSVYRTMLSCIRGLGWETTLTILKTFPSMERLIEASIDDLTKLPKIGRKTAEAIYAAVHYEFKR